MVKTKKNILKKSKMYNSCKDRLSEYLKYNEYIYLKKIGNKIN